MMTTIKEILETASRDKIVRIPTGNNFYVYRGHPAARYCTELTLKVIEIAALKLYCEFPKRNDRRLNIGNFSLSDGRNPATNPAHWGGWRGDFNYFTFHSNITHYGDPLEKIWMHPERGCGLFSDRTQYIFDTERQRVFFYAILGVMPEAEILVSTGIKKLFQDRRIRDTGATAYNHHLHCHIDFNGPVNSDYKINCKGATK